MPNPTPKNPDLDAISARLAAATPGKFGVSEDWCARKYRIADDESGNFLASVYNLADADFIAAAPADIAALLEYARRLEARADRAEKYLSEVMDQRTVEGLAKSEALDRAKEAEAQRDWLADVLISKSYCPDMYNQCANPEDRGCVSSTAEQKKACWLEWAASQAREGAKS
ncbi:hypothetical protein LJC46_08270 [Desulfovibrio sp. OttesenSCG-928-G15]|nr:hypothetical protein [Desulfovibrio sp. OttesenSCG-928-G15]